MGSAKTWIASPFLLLLGAFGCADDGPTDPALMLELGDGAVATMQASGNDMLWWVNTIDNASYRHASTPYQGEWKPFRSPLDLTIDQTASGYLHGIIDLPDEVSIEFTDWSSGFGWRAIYPPDDHPIVAADLEAMGMDPALAKDDATDYRHCEVADSRILVALSNYSGTMDDLWADATASAEEQGLAQPDSWYDVVQDPVMYEQLFDVDHDRTRDLREATFAYLSVELDPLCGQKRVAFRSASNLVGPITVIEN